MADTSTDKGYKPDPNNFLPKPVDYSLSKVIFFYLVLGILVYFVIFYL